MPALFRLILLSFFSLFYHSPLLASNEISDQEGKVTVLARALFKGKHDRNLLLLQNEDGKKVLFYESTGVNSQSAKTMFPFKTITYQLTSLNHLSPYLEKEYTSEEENKKIEAAIGNNSFNRRFGSLSLLKISYQLGGGFWEREEVKAINSFQDLEKINWRQSTENIQTIEIHDYYSFAAWAQSYGYNPAHRGPISTANMLFAQFGYEILLSLNHDHTKKSKTELMEMNYYQLCTNVSSLLKPQALTLLSPGGYSSANIEESGFSRLVTTAYMEEVREASKSGGENFFKITPRLYFPNGEPSEDEADAVIFQQINTIFKKKSASKNSSEKDFSASEAYSEIMQSLAKVLQNPSHYKLPS